MTGRKRILTACAALCALTLLMTGCRSKKDEGEMTPSPTPITSPNASPDVSPGGMTEQDGTESGQPHATMAPNLNNAAVSFTPGVYTASAKGMKGDVTVEVEFTASAIKKIQVLAHQETDGIWEEPVDSIPQAIIEKQSLNVETVSGATMTSNAILQAVEDCVRQAGADPEQLKKQPSVTDDGANGGGMNGENNGMTPNITAAPDGNIVGDIVNGAGDVVDDIGEGIGGAMNDVGDAINGSTPTSTP